MTHAECWNRTSHETRFEFAEDGAFSAFFRHWPGENPEACVEKNPDRAGDREISQTPKVFGLNGLTTT